MSFSTAVTFHGAIHVRTYNLLSTNIYVPSSKAYNVAVTMHAFLYSHYLFPCYPRRTHKSLSTNRYVVLQHRLLQLQYVCFSTAITFSGAIHVGHTKTAKVKLLLVSDPSGPPFPRLEQRHDRGTERATPILLPSHSLPLLTLCCLSETGDIVILSTS